MKNWICIPNFSRGSGVTLKHSIVGIQNGFLMCSGFLLIENDLIYFPSDLN